MKKSKLPVLVTHVVLGYLRTVPAVVGGGGDGVPPRYLETTGPILHLKTAFDSSEQEPSEYIAELYVNTTYDVTVKDKRSVFYHAIAGFAGQSSRIKLKSTKRHGFCLGYWDGRANRFSIVQISKTT